METRDKLGNFEQKLDNISPKYDPFISVSDLHILASENKIKEELNR